MSPLVTMFFVAKVIEVTCSLNAHLTPCSCGSTFRTLRHVRRTRFKKVQESAGANVRRLRLRAGWTQEDLAEHAGIDWRSVQEVERARTNFTLAVLVSLADALEVDPRELLRPATLPPARPGRPRARAGARSK